MELFPLAVERRQWNEQSLSARHSLHSLSPPPPLPRCSQLFHASASLPSSHRLANWKFRFLLKFQSHWVGTNSERFGTELLAVPHWKLTQFFFILAGNRDNGLGKYQFKNIAPNKPQIMCEKGKSSSWKGSLDHVVKGRAEARASSKRRVAAEEPRGRVTVFAPTREHGAINMVSYVRLWPSLVSPSLSREKETTRLWGKRNNRPNLDVQLFKIWNRDFPSFSDPIEWMNVSSSKKTVAASFLPIVVLFSIWLKRLEMSQSLLVMTPVEPSSRERDLIFQLPLKPAITNCAMIDRDREKTCKNWVGFSSHHHPCLIFIILEWMVSCLERSEHR